MCTHVLQTLSERTQSPDGLLGILLSHLLLASRALGGLGEAGALDRFPERLQCEGVAAPA